MINQNNRLIDNLGLSLLEVLTVFAIIATMALVMLPIIGRYSLNLELNNSAKQLVSNLKLAQQYTVTQQYKHSIKIDLLSKTYYLIKKEPVEQTLLTFSLDDNVIFSSVTGIQNNEVVYNSSGAVDYSGDIELTHLQSNNKNKVYVKPSGYTTWQKISE